MTIDEFLALPNDDGSRKTKRDFAASIGVTQTMVTEYAAGRAWPSRPVMTKMLIVSGGRITPNDVLGVDEILRVNHIGVEAALQPEPAE